MQCKCQACRWSSGRWVESLPPLGDFAGDGEHLLAGSSSAIQPMTLLGTTKSRFARCRCRVYAKRVAMAMPCCQTMSRTSFVADAALFCCRILMSSSGGKRRSAWRNRRDVEENDVRNSRKEHGSGRLGATPRKKQQEKRSNAFTAIGDCCRGVVQSSHTR